MPQKQSGITAMALMHIDGFGIILAGRKFRRANLRRIPSKETMRNCDITWRVWLVNHVAFLVAHLRSNALCAFLSIVSTADNFTNNIIQIIPHM
jgi:hypothetical protein